MWEVLSFLGSFLGSIAVIVGSIVVISFCGMWAIAGLKEKYCAICNKTTDDRVCKDCKPRLVA